MVVKICQLASDRLGVVIEKVSGESYYAYVREHIYNRAGNDRNRFRARGAAVAGRSIGYTGAQSG